MYEQTNYQTTKNSNIEIAGRPIAYYEKENPLTYVFFLIFNLFWIGMSGAMGITVFSVGFGIVGIIPLLFSVGGIVALIFDIVKLVQSQKEKEQVFVAISFDERNNYFYFYDKNKFLFSLDVNDINFFKIKIETTYHHNARTHTSHHTTHKHLLIDYRFQGDNYTYDQYIMKGIHDIEHVEYVANNIVQQYKIK